MKICCLGGIHYHGSQYGLDKLAENIRDSCSSVDAVVVVGDITSSGRLDLVHDVLSTIRVVADALIMVVPGNHDIYLSSEEMKIINSLTKLHRFNDFVEELGCIVLMKNPYIVNGMGFVGSIAWYNYSFAPEWLGLSIEDFRAKSFGPYTWADRDYVKLPFSDEEFTLMLLNKFEEHIRHVYSSINRIVAVLHHVPFRKLVKHRLEPSWDYFSTFMGSEAFGYVIRKYSDKIELVLYGLQHNGVETGVCRGVEGIECCNCALPIPMVIEL